MIIGLRTEKIPIPHEPGEWMECRTKLPQIELEKSMKARQARAFADMGAVIKEVGVEGLREIFGSQEEDKPIFGNPEEDEDPKNKKKRGKGKKSNSIEKGTQEDEFQELREQCDLDSAASALVVRWSYTHPNDGSRIPVTYDTIRSLDAKTRKWLHDITWLALRPETEEESEGNF